MSWRLYSEQVRDDDHFVRRPLLSAGDSTGLSTGRDDYETTPASAHRPTDNDSRRRPTAAEAAEAAAEAGDDDVHVDGGVGRRRSVSAAEVQAHHRREEGDIRAGEAQEGAAGIVGGVYRQHGRHHSRASVAEQLHTGCFCRRRQRSTGDHHASHRQPRS